MTVTQARAGMKYFFLNHFILNVAHKGTPFFLSMRGEWRFFITFAIDITVSCNSNRLAGCCFLRCVRKIME